jgi:Zn-dependent protease with chaperone function
MAIDFFDREEHARRQTRRLLALFTVAVATIILAIYLLLVPFTTGLMLDIQRSSGRPTWEHRMPGGAWNVHRDLRPGPFPGVFWDPPLFFCVAGATLLVISVASLHKISEFSGGGETVALMLGGRAVNPQTTVPAERRLLDVVEEMALASGVPVPPVYVLEHEPGINAFAAGHRPADAVVAVSAGCLHYLNRDELQGVLGHEFSHILNGDMRLNLRLTGLVFGILVLSVLGYYLMRSVRYIGSGGSRGRGAGVALGIFLLGGVLWLLGVLGVLFGKLIKSAICRQREFLADASSVQFTRNPAGLAGALKKIGGLGAGSHIRDGHAAEISHMFFSSAGLCFDFGLLATHPPLVKRILALEPQFDGQFPGVQPAAATGQGEPGTRRQPMSPVADASPVMACADGSVAGRVGRPQTEHLRRAAQITGNIPQALLDAAREPYAARAVIYALLLSPADRATRDRQVQVLQARLEPPLCQQTQALASAVQSLDAAARLPLVDLAVPALKKSSPRQYAEFRQVVDALMRAEGKIELFEYCLHLMLLDYLDVFFHLRKPPAIRYRAVAAVAQPTAVVLSTLAYLGAKGPEDAPRAFQAGIKVPGTLRVPFASGTRSVPDTMPDTILPKPQCGLREFDAAVTVLAQAAPAVKRIVIQAVAACVAADGQVTVEESELLRAITAALACPLPPGL